jgi:hypothetical protein
MRQKKEYDFVVILKHSNYKMYNVITILMCMMTLMAEAFALSHSIFFDLFWVNIVLSAFIIFTFIKAFTGQNKQDTIVTFKWPLYAAAFLWLLYPLHLPFIGIFFIIAALLERQIKFPQEVGFSTEAITFNTFPFKNYVWLELNNVMLKDNMLTLDFADNKIIQKETETDISPETEKEFNEFCQAQLLNKS